MNRRSFLLGTTAIVSVGALPALPAAPANGMIRAAKSYGRRLSNEELCAASAHGGMDLNFMTGRARFGGRDVDLSSLVKLEGNAHMTSQGLFIGDGGRAQLNIASDKLQCSNNQGRDPRQAGN